MLTLAMAACAVAAGVSCLAARPGARRFDVCAALPAGASLGLTLFLWLPYLLARPLGIERGAWASLVVLAVLAVAGIVFRTSQGRGSVSSATPRRVLQSPRWPAALVIAIAAALAWLLFNASLRVRADGIYSAGGGCEDMGMHATLAFAFLRSPDRVLHPTYPIYPGWPLGYPFLADFSAATAMALGASPGFAFFSTAAFALAVLVGNAWHLARRWLSAPYAALAIVLFLFGGNLGFVFFLRDLPADGFWGVWLNDYVANFNLGLHYGNMATTVLIPMRTSLFGVPLAFAVLGILCRGRPRAVERLAAGAMFGALPLVNAHAFLATALCVAAYLLRDLPRRLRRWWPALAVAVTLALPQLLWIHTQTAVSDGAGFVRAADGYLSATPLPWPTYMLLNGGLFVPLAFGAWWFAPRRLRMATIPLLLLFPLCLAVWFQPNPFDNIKLLLFFHLGGALLIADLCRRSVARGGVAVAFAAIAVAICTGSGLLAWVREANIPCRMATTTDRDFAALVLQQTDERSVVLTSSRFTHPVPFLTGRPIVLGFHNWLSQHGIPYTERAKEVVSIYDGDAGATALIAKYGITDVVVGPTERDEFPGLDESFIAGLATTRFSLGPYALYRLKPAAATPVVAPLASGR